MKICLTCSHGGHLTEILQLMDAFKGHDIFFITYEGARSKELFPKYTIKNLGDSPVKFLMSIPIIFRVLIKEKPDLIISTGSEIALPVFYVGKLLGIKTMFIESLCRIKGPSLTGRLIYPVSNVFLVQWKELLDKYGKKAQYWGNVL
jgi:beta-1,4-N-acetylglucosaminyltransferase